MKKLMMGLALAALAATPALANGNQARMSNAGNNDPGYSAYDYAPGAAIGAYDVAPGSAPVFVDGHYVGADPDPFIRNQMRRYPTSIVGGGN
jgi:hypothetical protein